MTSSLRLGFEMPQKRKSDKTAAIEALRVVTRFMSQLSNAEMEALLAGRARLSLEFNQGNITPEPHPNEAPQLQEIALLLSEVDSTEAAYAVFGKYDLSRAQLEKMARSIDVAVRKEDTGVKLIDKLVEALVGSRLNSRAIRGNS